MKFEPIKPGDYARYKPFFKHQRYELAAYSLPANIVWNNHVYHARAAVSDNMLLLAAEFTGQTGKRYMVLPITEGPEPGPEELARILDAAGYTHMEDVPEDYILRHGREELEKFFVLERDEIYDDYIYNAYDLMGLAGKKYAKKRNLIRQFEREYGGNGTVTFEPYGREAAAECMDFLEEWCAERDCHYEEDEDLTCERQAAINALELGASAGFSGIVLRMEGRVRAFALASALTPDMGSLNFEKALASVKGLYQYFDRECARRLFCGRRFLNKESDMGLPGLAKAKKSYLPVRMVPAYKMARR